MRRIDGLDGLRAIAASLVLIYHLVPGWAGLGYVGVDIFFVLSGFLITSLLLVSFENGRPGLRDFWARRFRRLFPAVFVATVGSAAAAFIVGGDALVALGRQVFGSLTAAYNWSEIISGSSYFEESSPLLLTNMWSLAVEQQFYLVWPLIVLILVTLRRRWRIAACLALAAGSIGLHAALVGDDVTRAYMGTDTHLWGLMAGAALAFAAQRTVTGPEEPPRSRLSPLWGWAGWLALLSVTAAALLLPNSPSMYPWGMVTASILALLVIRALLPDVQHGSAARLRVLLGGRAISWVGVRSYGIYLWHWPLYVLLYYRFPLLSPGAAAIIVVVLSALLADLSFRYVEDPIRRAGLRRWAAAQRDKIAAFNPAAAIAAVAAPAAAVALAAAAVITAPAVSSGQQAVEDGRAAVSRPHDGDVPDGRGRGKGAQPDPSPEPQSTAPQSSPEPDLEEPAVPLPTSWDQVTIIGDSVVVAAHGSLEQAMPGVTVDGEESRSVAVAPAIIAEHAAAGMLGDWVVISLATNSQMTEEDIDLILNAAGPDRTLVLVTAFGPARVTWIPHSNEAIEAAARRHPDRIIVADWHAAIADHTDLLAGDIIHPGRAGAEIYAQMIRQSLSPPGAEDPGASR